MTRVLTTSGKLFLRDAGATANEPSPALVWAHFTSDIARRMQYSCRLIPSYGFTQIQWRVVVHCFVNEYICEEWGVG